MEILGVIAIAFGAFAYILKSPRKIMVFSAASSATWVLYFLSIDQIGPMLVTLTFGMLLIAGVFVSDRVIRVLSIGRLIIDLPLVIFTMSGIPMALVLCGTLAKGLSPILRDRPYLYRLIVACGECLWLTFGLVVGAHSTVASSALALLMIIGSALYFGSRERAMRASPEVLAIRPPSAA